jgi:predicted Rossmann-fold nucleotide-binding protein
MTVRRLAREYGLMLCHHLGSAGTIAASVLVLTGQVTGSMGAAASGADRFPRRNALFVQGFGKDPV